MALLSGLIVAQLGAGLAASVCGRLFVDLGATVVCVEPDFSTPLAVHLNGGKALVALPAISGADLIVCQDGPDTVLVRAHNAMAPIVTISPFGQTGPRAADPATDLTITYASGIARLLSGQVDDLAEAPIRAVGEQSAFIAGLAAACAGMHAVMAPSGGGQPRATIDVSMREALATLAITELARAGQTGRAGSRKRLADGNGATVCILPARDGYVAISPREDKQWEAWLAAMGSPAWGAEPRFAKKSDRVANWDALHALMAEWSRRHDKQWIADLAQAAHVPSFPLRDLTEHFASPQLAHRGFWREVLGGARMPGSPFGLTLFEGRGPRGWRRTGDLPLAGVRVLDFSWVIAGPTATRYLAAMGAEVIKIEAPGRGDPGRGSELHTVLGQSKKAIVLDLKRPSDIEAARLLAKSSDVLVENFATGVMDRLGLGAAALRSVNPDLIYVSASGLGRTGPEAHAVAYGTLLQCYAGFAGLNRHPGTPPRVGFAWLDPMLGLMMAFATAASLWRRRETGNVARVDCSMIEALLWTLAGPLLAAQTGSPLGPVGNYSAHYAPHGAWRCAGDDAWLSLAVRDDADWRALCGIVPGLVHPRVAHSTRADPRLADFSLAEPGLADMSGLDFAGRIAHASAIDAALSDWCAVQKAPDAAAALTARGVPAAALANSVDLVRSEHLRTRGFWDNHGAGVIPGLPWRASFGRAIGLAPALGADTEAVFRAAGLPVG